MDKVQDPICGMQIDKNSAIKITKDGKEYFFCSTHCRDEFIKQQGREGVVACEACSEKPLLRNKLFIITNIAILLILASFFIPFFEPFRKGF